MAELQPGGIFAGHRIEGVVGRGGMGVVYRAMHLALDHEVALKVIAAEVSSDETFRARFRDEARSAASIRHPNVVSVRHAGEEDGIWFVTMDLIEGTDLRRLLRAEGPLSPERAVAIAEQVASALDAAHKRGLVHRDVKPGNILIEPDGSEELVFLTDFGLTKRIEETSGLTRTGAFVGTIDYCAPEQIQRGAITPRTDVYALGCVLYEMLSGLTPFGQAEEDVAKIYAHLQKPVPAIGDLTPDVPPVFDEVLQKALAKDPAERYESAGELAMAARLVLASAPAGMPTATPPTVPSTVEHDPPQPPSTEAPTVLTPQAPSGRRSWPVATIVAALAAAAVVVAVLVAGGGGDDANPVAVGDRMDVSGFPVGVAVSGDDVWVGARRGKQLTRLVNGTERETVDVSYRPEGMAVDGNRLLVASSDPGLIVGAVPGAEPVDTGGSLRGIEVFDGVAWAADHDGDRVVRSDGLPAIDVGKGPNGVAAGEGSIWVTNRDVGTVSRIDPRERVVEATVEVASEPKGLTVAEGFVWVANTASDSVSVIDASANAVDEVIEGVGGDPRDVAFGEGFIWVSNGELDADGEPTMEGTVTQIDPGSREIVAVIDVGGSPEDITVGAGHVWVATGAGNELVRIDP